MAGQVTHSSDGLRVAAGRYSSLDEGPRTLQRELPGRHILASAEHDQPVASERPTHVDLSDTGSRVGTWHPSKGVRRALSYRRALRDPA